MFIVTGHGCYVYCSAPEKESSSSFISLFCWIEFLLFLFTFSFLPTSFIFLLFVAISLLSSVVSSCVLREQRPKEKLERGVNNKSRKHAE